MKWTKYCPALENSIEFQFTGSHTSGIISDKWNIVCDMIALLLMKRKVVWLTVVRRSRVSSNDQLYLMRHFLEWRCDKYAEDFLMCTFLGHRKKVKIAEKLKDKNLEIVNHMKMYLEQRMMNDSLQWKLTNSLVMSELMFFSTANGFSKIEAFKNKWNVSC